MIKVTYYIRMNDKDTLKQELTKNDFTTEFDRVFKDYTITEAQRRFTNRIGEITIERSLIITTFVDNCEEVQLRKLIQENYNILKLTLNQESILVEVTEPGVIFC